MLDAFIIEQLKKIEQRRQQQTPLELPVVEDLEDPPAREREKNEDPKGGIIIIDYGN